jgi:hypothetical protein
MAHGQGISYHDDDHGQYYEDAEGNEYVSHGLANLV